MTFGGFVDDGGDSQRDAHLADFKAVRHLPPGYHLADRIGLFDET